MKALYLRSTYPQDVDLRYPHLTLHKSGIYIGNPAYLGASPDGVVVDKSCTVIGIIEIKKPLFCCKANSTRSL